MLLFFFHLCDVDDLFDEEGKELPTLEAAVAHAQRAALDIMSSDIREGHLNLNYRIEITNEQGQVVHVLHFRDLVAVTGQRAN